MSTRRCRNALSKYLTQEAPQTLWIRSNESSPCENETSTKLCSQYGSAANPALLQDIPELLKKYPVESTVVLYVDAGTHGSPQDVTTWNRNVIVYGTGATTFQGLQVIEPSTEITFVGILFRDTGIQSVNNTPPLVKITSAKDVKFSDCTFLVDTFATAIQMNDVQKGKIHNVTMTRSFYTNIPLFDIVSTQENTILECSDLTAISLDNTITRQSDSVNTEPTAWSLLFSAVSSSPMTLTLDKSSFVNGGIYVKSSDNSQYHISMSKTTIESAQNDCAMDLIVSDESTMTVTLSDNVFDGTVRDDQTKSVDLRPLRNILLKDKGVLKKTSKYNITRGHRLNELVRATVLDESQFETFSSFSTLQNYGDNISTTVANSKVNMLTLINNTRHTENGTILKCTQSGTSTVNYHAQNIQNTIAGESGKFYYVEMNDFSKFIGNFYNVSSIRSHATPAIEPLQTSIFSGSSEYSSKNINISSVSELENNVYQKQRLIHDNARVTRQEANCSTTVSSGNAFLTTIDGHGFMQTIQNGNFYSVDNGSVHSLYQSDSATIRSLESTLYAVAKTYHDYFANGATIQNIITLSNMAGFSTDANKSLFRYMYETGTLFLRHQAVAASNSHIPIDSSPDKALVYLSGKGVKLRCNDSSYTHTGNPALSTTDGAQIATRNSRMTSASEYGTVNLNTGKHTIATSLLENLSGGGSSLRLSSNAFITCASTQLTSDRGSTVDGDNTAGIEFGTCRFSTSNENVVEKVKTVFSSASHFFSQSDTLGVSTQLQFKSDQFTRK